MGNRSKKTQSVEQQALYKRRHPLRSTQTSLIRMVNSFATQQRRLLDQIQQRLSAKGAQRDTTPGDQNPTDAASSQQAPPTKLRTTLRDATKSSQKRESKSGPQREKEKPKQASFVAAQEKQGEGSSDDELQLNAPPPRTSVTTIEGLSELLFSEEHLNYLVQDPILFRRFTESLARYQPELVAIVLHHIEIQKAAKALEYANAVASNLGPFPGDSEAKGIQTAAAMNSNLEERRQRVIDILMSEALPTQINFRLIDVVTNAMQRAIRGNQQTAIMRNLIGGLTEVFTLTDPSIDDNPIIYASEEFYNMTGYGRDFVIGRNCRFLQGPKTSRHSVHRLRTNIDNGIEISETLLNYRRDGTPFMNLLLVAPLHDNKGDIKYYIGAQVDVTGLVNEGEGLDEFTGFLKSRKKQDDLRRRGPRDAENTLPLQKLAELSQMFDVAENAVIRTHSRSNSLTRDSGYGSGQTNPMKQNRRLIIEDSTSDEDDGVGKSQDAKIVQNELKWKLAPPGAPTGILPGVYQKYLLLRPAPSLKVIFVSPALRKLSKLSKKGFLECIESSRGTMEGLKSAFTAGMAVSAKVSWKHDTKSFISDEQKDKTKRRRDTWISATPMLGSDDSIGVWMIVVVQDVDAKKPEAEASTQRLSVVSMPDIEPRPENTKRRSIFADKEVPESETRKNDSQTRYSQVSAGSEQREAETTPRRPNSNSISSPFMTPKAYIPNGPNVSSNRKYSLSQSIPFPRSYSDISTPESDKRLQDPDAETELPALQDLDGVENRRKSSRVEGDGELPRGRVRIKYISEDEDDDSGVDTVEEGGKVGKDGRDTPEKNREELETWSPPSKGIWSKPPRPSLPNRMMSVD